MGSTSVRGALDNAARVIRLSAPPMKLTYAHQDDEYTCLRYMTSDGKRTVWVGGEIRRIAGPITVGERYPIMYQAELRCASANIDTCARDHRSHSMVHQEVSSHRAELAEWLTGELLARLPKE